MQGKERRIKTNFQMTIVFLKWMGGKTVYDVQQKNLSTNDCQNPATSVALNSRYDNAKIKGRCHDNRKGCAHPFRVSTRADSPGAFGAGSDRVMTSPELRGPIHRHPGGLTGHPSATFQDRFGSVCDLITQGGCRSFHFSLRTRIAHSVARPA